MKKPFKPDTLALGVAVCLSFSPTVNAGFMDALNKEVNAAKESTEAAAPDAAKTTGDSAAAATEAVPAAAAEPSVPATPEVPAVPAAPAAETAVPAATEAATASTGSGSSLVDTLSSQLGVSTEQAEGGAGSLFEMAKKNLSEEDFQSVANVVPGMDSMLGAAPKSEAAGGLANSLSGIGGDSVGGALDAASVVDSFKQLGLSSDMIGKFTPVVVDYVKTQGGETVANLLSSALTGL